MSALEIQALGGQNLLKVAQDVNASRWVSAAALTILIYDTLLTLGDEVRLIWPKKLSLIKILTNVNRIAALGFIFLNTQHLAAVNRSFSNDFCEKLLISTAIGALICFAMSNWILLARTKALLGESRILNYGLALYYIGTYSLTTALVMHTSVSLPGSIFYSKTLRVCGIAFRPSTMGYIWLPSVIFETTVFMLTIVKLYQKARQTSHVGSTLLVILYRDGVCYYFIMIALRIFNFLSWLVFPVSLTLIGVFILWSVMTIAVTRLQLNLLRAVEPGASSSVSFLTRKSKFGVPYFSTGGTRNHRIHTIEVTTTTTQHRDYPPTAEFFQLRSIGEPRKQDPDASSRKDRSRSRGRGLARFSKNESTPDLEAQGSSGMRAVLNSRGRVVLKEGDAVEIAKWETARSRERLV